MKDDLAIEYQRRSKILRQVVLEASAVEQTPHLLCCIVHKGRLALTSVYQDGESGQIMESQAVRNWTEVEVITKELHGLGVVFRERDVKWWTRGVISVICSRLSALPSAKVGLKSAAKAGDARLRV